MLEAVCFFLRALSREELLEVPKDTILLECRRLVPTLPSFKHI
ncbi:MAG: hypothetical protein ACO2OZ_09830 [Acidilobaceae archaeon]